MQPVTIRHLQWLTLDDVRADDTQRRITPQNIAILSGSYCIMAWRPANKNTKARWLFSSSGSSTEVLIYNRYNVSPIYQQSYKIGSDRYESRNLIIDLTRLSHAGCYTIDELGHQLKESAELIVIGK